MRSGFLSTLVVVALGGAFTATPAAATVTSGVTAAGVLTVSSDDGDFITVNCQSGVVKINNLNPDTGPVACSAITESHVFGGTGADTITMTDVTAVLFPALTSSEIQGFGDIDSVAGSGIGDTITGGPGADDLTGRSGSDVVVWNPGDGSDLIDGEGDSDAMIVNGNPTAGEVFIVNPNGARVEVLRDIGSIDLDIGTTELLVLNGLGGADTMTANDGVGPLIAIAMNGGGDGDELNGADGGDMLDGGGGADEVNGNAGNDNLLIRDDTPDTASCGGGADSVTADAQGVDTIASDCESVGFPELPELPELPVTPGDTAAPDTQITASPKAKTKKKQASFSFTSTETGSTFQCKLDDDPFAACTSPFEDKVKKGKHVFEVRAIDAAGNVDPTPAEFDWKVAKKK